MGWYVFLALLVVPVAEIALIVAVGSVIGGWQTLALLLAESALVPIWSSTRDAAPGRPW